MQLQNEIAGYNEELSLLQSNQKINSDATDLSVEKVKQMTTYYRTRTTQIKDAIFKLGLKISAVNELTKNIAYELQKLNDYEKEKRGNITIKLDTKTATNIVLNIKYNINKAGWFPLYDVKATNVDAPISWSYKANVYQQSGTNWEDVNLVLSTGDPTTNNNKPLMSPKYLEFVSRNYRAQSAIKGKEFKYNPTITNVTGVVLDDAGLPLPGTNVIVKGTSNGTQTDYEGNYSINVSGNRELVYTYVGFTTATRVVHASTMNITLDADASLAEVAVVGNSRSTRKRKDTRTYAEAIAGQVPGLQVTSASGQPGGNATVRIRGISSINGDAEPLFIIDGVPYDQKQFRNLNPDDVASVSVIKDPQALSIYGNRGANGVIIIKTKENRETGTGIIKETNITNTRFEIPTKYTINSNQDITVIEIDNFSIDASYEHYAAPELNENVFITASIKDWEQYNLLVGEANIYFDGNYAGKTTINPSTITADLELSLGIDPNVQVTREKLNNFKSKTFFGTNRILDRAFEINIKNNKNIPINLVLEDRIPVSQNKEIKVDNIETADGDYNEETGVIVWKIDLKPTDTLKKNISFTLKYPKWKSISL